MIEAPPNALGFVDDIWQRYVTDIGLAGPRQGGGRQVPDPAARSRRRRPRRLLRRPVADLLELAGHPRSRWRAGPDDHAHLPAGAGRRPAAHGVPELLPGRVQRRPRQRLLLLRGGRLDRRRRARRRARPRARRAARRVGIVAGKPFAPDERMRSILDEAARIGAAIVRSLVFAPRDPDVYYYPDSTWATAFVGGSHEFLANGARLLDARAMMHYVGHPTVATATGSRPAPARAGSRSCASTDHWSPGSTRRGGSERSSRPTSRGAAGRRLGQACSVDWSMT